MIRLNLILLYTVYPTLLGPREFGRIALGVRHDDGTSKTKSTQPRLATTSVTLFNSLTPHFSHQVHPADVAPGVGGVGEELPAAEAHPLPRPLPRNDLEEVPRRPSHKVAGQSGHHA